MADSGRKTSNSASANSWHGSNAETVEDKEDVLLHRCEQESWYYSAHDNDLTLMHFSAHFNQLSRSVKRELQLSSVTPVLVSKNHEHHRDANPLVSWS